MSKDKNYKWERYYIVRRVSSDGLIKKFNKEWGDGTRMDDEYTDMEDAEEAIMTCGHENDGAIILPIYRYEYDWGSDS